MSIDLILWAEWVGCLKTCSHMSLGFLCRQPRTMTYAPMSMFEPWMNHSSSTSKRSWEEEESEA